jgi:3-oxoadipate enol-lactonase
MPEAHIGDARLHFEDTGGNGPLVLLLHGFPFHSGMWEPQLDALGGRFHMVAPDLRGFGGSEAPHDSEGYSLDAYADDAAALLRHLGRDRAVVVGLSMGGYVALAMQRRHPEVVGGLVLCDTRADADAPEVRDRRSKQQDRIRDGELATVKEELLAGLLSERTRRSRPDLAASVRRLMDAPASAYLGALEAMKRRPDSTGLLGRISAPTLVVVGEDDAISPPEVARSLVGSIPGARLMVVAEAGHLSNLESPERFNDALANFLEAL